jgi:hypothetical protein
MVVSPAGRRPAPSGLERRARKEPDVVARHGVP